MLVVTNPPPRSGKFYVCKDSSEKSVPSHQYLKKNASQTETEVSN